MRRSFSVLCLSVAILSLFFAQPARPNGVAFNIGDVFAADSSGTIFHYSSTFTLLDTLNTGLGGYQTGMAFDSALALYATNFSNSSITKFSTDGNIAMPNPFVTNDASSQNESIVFNAAGEFFVGQPDGTRDIIKRAADGTFIARYDVTTGTRGADWVELAADQKTIYYTSEGNIVYRFDTSTNTQLPDFATGLPGANAFALRFLPNGDLLVADSDRVVRLDSTGAIVQTYFPPGAIQLFALNLEPNGTTFLTADTNGTIYRINIASGTVTDTFPAGTSIFGLAVAGELTAGGGMDDGGLLAALPQREILLNIDRVATRDINARLFRLRAGGEPVVEVMPPQPSGKEILTRNSGGKVVLSDKEYKESPVAEIFRRFIFFADGDFGRADQHDINLRPGFNGDTYAATLGAEYRATRELAFGFGGTYVTNDTSLNGGLAKLDIQGFAVSTYASWARSNFYLDLLYSFGFYEDDIHRTTLFDTIVTANPDSTNHTVALNGGYKFHCGQLVTGPIATLEYINGELDGYSESGMGGITIERQNYQSLVSKLGWQASYRVRTGFGGITPQLRASWERENLDVDDPVVAHLGGLILSANAPRPDDDYLAVGGGLLVDVGRRFMLVADVEDHLARDERNDLFASIRAAVKF
jgi:uncharacterized protein YhjY with autotransporter beta-barrel domain